MRCIVYPALFEHPIHKRIRGTACYSLSPNHFVNYDLSSIGSSSVFEFANSDVKEKGNEFSCRVILLKMLACRCGTWNLT